MTDGGEMATVEWARTLPGAELFNFDDNDVPTMARFLFSEGRGGLSVHECDDGYCVTINYGTAVGIQLGPVTRTRFRALLFGLTGKE